MRLPAKVAETIHCNNLLRSNDSVLVGVSGGPDSVALLHCLVSLGYHVEAAHLNHQFRGPESEEDAAFVQATCKALSVKLTVESIDVPKLKEEQRISAQQAARTARYAFFERVRLRRNLDLIATAHNFDDRIETILINIVRGTGIDGLRGIPYRRGHIVRPLLDTPRTDVETYCAAANLTPRFDSSNYLSKYTRNNVRSELIPYLERRYNSNIRQSLFRLSEIASDESDYLNSIACIWLSSREPIKVSSLIAEPVALQRRILRAWIRSRVATELADVSHLIVEQLRTRCMNPVSITLPGAQFVMESDGAFLRIRDLAILDCVPPDTVPVAVGATTMFAELFVTIKTIAGTVDEPSLHIRQWIDGDRITLVGGTKKIQDLFTDKKVARSTRRSYPLIADKDGLIAVGNIAVAARAKGTIVVVSKADGTDAAEVR